MNLECAISKMVPIYFTLLLINKKIRSTVIEKSLNLDSPLSVRGAQRHCPSGKVAFLLQLVKAENQALIAPAQKARKMRKILHFPQHHPLQLPLKEIVYSELVNHSCILQA